MKKVLYLLFTIALVCCMQACKKADSSGSGSSADCNSLPVKVGSKLVYTLVSGGTQTNNFTKQTTYNGNNYVGATVSTPYGDVTSYLGKDQNNNIYQLIPATGDLPTANVIFYKPGQSVGASWSYTYNSVSMPSSIKYKYTVKVIKTGIVFVLAGKTYTDCSQMQITFETYYSGTVLNTKVTGFTYGCGIGIIQQYVDGSLSSTLTSYTY